MAFIAPKHEGALRPRVEVNKCHTSRVHYNAYAHWSVFAKLEGFAVSAMWLWLVQYEFAVSAIMTYILLSNNIATGYTVKPLIADPPKSGHPPYNGQILCPRLILPYQ